MPATKGNTMNTLSFTNLQTNLERISKTMQYLYYLFRSILAALI